MRITCRNSALGLWGPRRVALVIGLSGTAAMAVLVAWYLAGVRAQRAAVATLLAVGSEIAYDDDVWEGTGYDGPDSGGVNPKILNGLDVDGRRAVAGQPIMRDVFHHPVAAIITPFDDSVFTQQLIDAVGTLRGLRGLTIYGCPPPQIDWSPLRRLTRLETVELCDPRVVTCLTNAPALADLSVGPATDFDESGNDLWTKHQRAALGRLSQLKTVFLCMNDEDMVALKGLDRLEVISLSGPRLYGAGLVNIQDLPAVKDLRLDDSPLRDENLKFLGRAKALEWLSLYQTPIDGRGLRFLAALPSLERLLLGGTHVRDEALMTLVPLAALRSIDLTGTRVTDAGVERFHRARPDVEIRGGGK
jgi:hypothetical protein